jgi:hypothetical protein
MPPVKRECAIENGCGVPFECLVCPGSEVTNVRGLGSQVFILRPRQAGPRRSEDKHGFASVVRRELDGKNPAEAVEVKLIRDRALSHIPHKAISVRRAPDKQFAIRRKRDSGNIIKTTSGGDSAVRRDSHRNLAHSAQSPDYDNAIGSTGGHPPSIGREREARDRSSVATKWLANRSTLSRIASFAKDNGVIEQSRCDMTAVVRPSKRSDGRRMSDRNLEDRRSNFDVPDLERCRVSR